MPVLRKRPIQVHNLHTSILDPASKRDGGLRTTKDGYVLIFVFILYLLGKTKIEIDVPYSFSTQIEEHEYEGLISEEGKAYG